MKRLVSIPVMIHLLVLCGCADTTGAGAPADFGHKPFDEILRKHVNDKGLVNYAALRAEDRPRLDAYLDAIARTDPASLRSREERLAYWLNAYNAFTIAGVLDGYPLESVMDVKGFFKQRRYTAGGKKYALNEIENRVIRPTFKEPRIHFVLVCAAMSCPRLWSTAVDPRTLEQRLETSAREFINSPNGARVDRAKRELWVSAIFKWYRKDFEGDAGSVVNYVKRYLENPPPDLARYRLKFLDYDWALNEQRPSGAR